MRTQPALPTSRRCRWATAGARSSAVRSGRNLLVAVGILLIIVGVIIGPLPGPGFIPLFIGGLTLLLRYAKWSKRLYVRMKRRWPRHGAFADKGLRRASAKRRAKLAAARKAD